MTSTFTTNKSIEKPGNGDYANDWNVPVNADWSIIDQAFGGTTSLNVTGVSTTPVNLTIDSVNAALSYQSLLLTISGTLSNNVIYTIPSGVGGQWIVANGTTGAFNVIIASLGGGTSYAPPQGYKTIIVSDGTNITAAITTPVVAGGSNTQIQYNFSGGLAGSAGLTWNGTTLTANAISATTTIAATTNITAGGSITAAGNVTAYSDRSLKRDIQTIEHAVDLVKSLRGVTFEMINTGQQGIGVIAQEVQEFVPQVVQNNNGILSVAYGNLVGVLIEAVKELAARVETLEKK